MSVLARFQDGGDGFGFAPPAARKRKAPDAEDAEGAARAPPPPPPPERALGCAPPSASSAWCGSCAPPSRWELAALRRRPTWPYRAPPP